MGGQTALNLAKALAEQGILEKYGVRLIGASLEAINKAEDRQLFKAAMQKIGVALPKSGYATHAWTRRSRVVEDIGFPAIIRPSFTLGGTGGGIAYNRDEFETICRAGLKASPTSTMLVEESRARAGRSTSSRWCATRADNVIIVCSIENLDPMGVHTGDSITVAPAQTLTDKEYQRLRQASLAHHPRDRRRHRRLQHPVRRQPEGRAHRRHRDEPARVALVSALASKATGYPIAKVAAKLALGYTLDELRNDITRDTPASFEPTHRLRGGEGAALQLREVPPRRPHPHHQHALGGRGDGHRPHLPRGLPQGAALHGVGPHWRWSRPSCPTTPRSG